MRYYSIAALLALSATLLTPTSEAGLGILVDLENEVVSLFGSGSFTGTSGEVGWGNVDALNGESLDFTAYVSGVEAFDGLDLKLWLNGEVDSLELALLFTSGVDDFAVDYDTNSLSPSAIEHDMTAIEVAEIKGHLKSIENFVINADDLVGTIEELVQEIENGNYPEYELSTFSGAGDPVSFVVISSVPEPSTYALIFGSITLGCLMIWRRRSSNSRS
ncbi:PEP-CTERM sorting domain-containing protein [Cerasicoccus frondis]|uniref:PEP-CTERM sorting domain-containing protein n=1 Tax=Cerasicoccus frondis TaxID=490090 RepID=UPI002852C0DD|nr:PEP-CTERM sorting domain-containing protein [Cerasicoccus frondis]